MVSSCEPPQSARTEFASCCFSRVLTWTKVYLGLSLQILLFDVKKQQLCFQNGIRYPVGFVGTSVGTFLFQDCIF